MSFYFNISINCLSICSSCFFSLPHVLLLLPFFVSVRRVFEEHHVHIRSYSLLLAPQCPTRVPVIKRRRRRASWVMMMFCQQNEQPMEKKEPPSSCSLLKEANRWMDGIRGHEGWRWGPPGGCEAL